MINQVLRKADYIRPEFFLSIPKDYLALLECLCLDRLEESLEEEILGLIRESILVSISDQLGPVIGFAKWGRPILVGALRGRVEMVDNLIEPARGVKALCFG